MSLFLISVSVVRCCLSFCISVFVVRGCLLFFYSLCLCVVRCCLSFASTIIVQSSFFLQLFCINRFQDPISHNYFSAWDFHQNGFWASAVRQGKEDVSTSESESSSVWAGVAGTASAGDTSSSLSSCVSGTCFFLFCLVGCLFVRLPVCFCFCFCFCLWSCSCFIWFVYVYVSVSVYVSVCCSWSCACSCSCHCSCSCLFCLFSCLFVCVCVVFGRCHLDLDLRLLVRFANFGKHLHQGPGSISKGLLDRLERIRRRRRSGHYQKREKAKDKKSKRLNLSLFFLLLQWHSLSLSLSCVLFVLLCSDLNLRPFNS